MRHFFYFLFFCAAVSNMAAQDSVPMFSSSTAAMISETAYGNFLEFTMSDGTTDVVSISSDTNGSFVHYLDGSQWTFTDTGAADTSRDERGHPVINFQVDLGSADYIHIISRTRQSIVLYEGVIGDPDSFQEKASFVPDYFLNGMRIAKISNTEYYLTGKNNDTDQNENYTLVYDVGANTFSLEDAPAGIPAGNAGSHAFRDFDNDGVLDYFAVADSMVDGYYRQDSNGTYQLVQEQQTVVGDGLARFTVVDYDNDGIENDIVISPMYGGTLAVVTDFTATGFTESTNVGFFDAAKGDVAFAMQDGVRYAAVVGNDNDRTGEGTYDPYRIVVYRQESNGSWTIIAEDDFYGEIFGFTRGLHEANIALPDVDGDGRFDVLVSGLPIEYVPPVFGLDPREITQTRLYLQQAPVVADADGDGFADGEDLCPYVYSTTNTDTDGDGLGDACDSQDNRDSDGDGIENYADACPYVFGSASASGCPDSDGDGIVDSDDSCPDLWGDSSANGCPDADGDGFADGDDLCPDLYSVTNTDTDGDGLGDACDSQDNRDSDGDGIENYADSCPYMYAGTIDGCPFPDNPVFVWFSRVTTVGGNDGEVIFSSDYNLYEYTLSLINDAGSTVRQTRSDLADDVSFDGLSTGFYFVEIAIDEVQYFSSVLIDVEFAGDIAVNFDTYVSSSLNARVSGDVSYSARISNDYSGKFDVQYFDPGTMNETTITIQDVDPGDRVVVSGEYAGGEYEYVIQDQFDPEIIAYPNPTIDYVYLKNYTGFVSVYDLNGREIVQSQVSETAPIDMTGFSSGLYIVQVGGQTFKIQKQ